MLGAQSPSARNAIAKCNVEARPPAGGRPSGSMRMRRRHGDAALMKKGAPPPHTPAEPNPGNLTINPAQPKVRER